MVAVSVGLCNAVRVFLCWGLSRFVVNRDTSQHLFRPLLPRPPRARVMKSWLVFMRLCRRDFRVRASVCCFLR